MYRLFNLDRDPLFRNSTYKIINDFKSLAEAYDEDWSIKSQEYDTDDGSFAHHIQEGDVPYFQWKNSFRGNLYGKYALFEFIQSCLWFMQGRV